MDPEKEEEGSQENWGMGVKKGDPGLQESACIMEYPGPAGMVSERLGKGPTRTGM